MAWVIPKLTLWSTGLMVHTVYDNVRLAVSLYRPLHLCHLQPMTLIRRLQVQTLVQINSHGSQL